MVKLRLEELLFAECSYQRKGCTIRWIKHGENNMKFFHAMASERFRRNNIAMLKDDNGLEVSDHQLMAGLLRSSYKNQMRKPEGIVMQFDLSQLIPRVDCLDDLMVPFSK